MSSSKTSRRFGSGATLAWALILILCPGGLALAGGLGPVFRTLGVVEGLPDSRVEAMVQDQNGYVWIGTQSGLVRHEGHRLRRLSHDPAEPDSLPGANVMSLHAHSDGHVWAAISGQGLVEVRPDLSLSRHLRPAAEGGVLLDEPVWSMTEDCDGGLWLAYMRGGVARYDLASETLVYFPQDENQGLAETGFQMQIHADAQCRIWLVQTERIAVLPSPEATVFETVLARDREAGHAVFNALHERPDGTILAARISELLEASPVPSTEPLLEAEGSITGFADAEDGRILMSTYAGLLSWNPDNGQTEMLRHVEGLADGLPANTLFDILLDSEGGLWLAVFRNGVAYLPPGHAAFARYQPVPGNDQALGLRQVNGIAAAAEPGVLWLGSPDQGIERLDLGSGQVQAAAEFFDDDRFNDHRRARTVAQVGHELVFSWAREVWAYDPDTRDLRMLLERQQVDQGTFRFVQADDDQRFWVTTFDAGLIRVELAGGEREHYHPGAEGRFHWPEKEVNDLARDRHGRWWVAGREAVYRLSDSDRLEPMLEVETGPVLAMAWAGDELWLATEHVLGRWRVNGAALEPVSQIRLAGLLPAGRVFSILPQDANRVWLVLSNGLARLDADSDRFRLYSRPDGLAVAEFLRHSPLKLADGRLAIGSSNGLVLVRPDAVLGASSAPPVHMTGMVAGTERISLSPGPRDPIELAHRSNSVSLEYVALSYVFPEQTRYRIRLIGWDEEWLELVGQTRHFYSNLRPGQYRFQVQAATPDGLWNESGDELALIVLDPPWLSQWALMFYGLVLAGGAGAGWRGWRLTRQRRREMQEARQKRALAEEQRQVVERLNRNLKPESLAQVIGEEILAVTGGERAWLAYLDDQLPSEPIAVGVSAGRLGRESWQRLMDQEAGEKQMRIELTVENAPIAMALVEAGSAGFVAEHRERLELLIEMAAQALHNLLLIERVRALAERAEQASAAKSEFLATMSHEIRTPLHGVMGMVELLYETESNPGQQELLSTLQQSGRQLQRIIDDVLDISRIEAGRLSLEYEHFELASLLEQVVDLHAPNAARKNLDLRLRLARDLPLLAHGDPGRISQVLGNLLSNAVKFTDSGGIELVAECSPGGKLKLSVADSGPGIGPEDRERLFEPFMQLDASITRSHSGSGLGLAICRRLVAAMDGQIRLAEHRGRGCRFELLLPVLVLPESPEPLSALLAGCRVAACLDAPSLRVLRRIGHRWGFVVLDARRLAPESCDALLLKADSPPAPCDLSHWRARAGLVVALDIPFRRAEGPTDPGRAEQLLRWPLVESRLVGLLFDRALESRR